MDTQFKTYLAGQLRTFRRNAGLTQAELAARINRTGEAISNIERGKSQPTLETLIAVAETLEVPMRDFFPSGGFDDSISQNRLKTEAEAMALLRGLTDTSLPWHGRRLRRWGNCRGQHELSTILPMVWTDYAREPGERRDGGAGISVRRRCVYGAGICVPEHGEACVEVLLGTT